MQWNTLVEIFGLLMGILLEMEAMEVKALEAITAENRAR